MEKSHQVLGEGLPASMSVLAPALVEEAVTFEIGAVADARAVRHYRRKPCDNDILSTYV